MKNLIKFCLLAAMCAPSLSYAIGAFAIDDESGNYEAGYGISTGYDDEESAFQAAMELCADAGNEDCRRISWFETCGSYAASEEEYGAGWGSTASDAQAMAMDKCDSDDCRVIATECED